MCQSQADGGKRCTYADQISNVRKKALYKHRNDYDMHRKAEEAVNAWKDQNKTIVAEHLPEKQPFQVPGNKKRIPDSLLALLTKNSRTAVTGLPEEERKALTLEMYNQQEEWFENILTQEEQSAVKQYTMAGFEVVNSLLRRKGMSQLLKENPFYNPGEREEQGRRQIAQLDSALQKAPRQDKIQKLYRFFRVPAGITPTDFIDRYFKDGDAFKDRGFMSTTADPEFILAHMHKRNNGNRNHGYVVMEILTKKGASLQPDEASRAGDIQSLEKEVLLPRNMKLRVAASRSSQTFKFASNRDDLNNQYYNYEKNFREGDKMRFPLIQLVDEQLIRDS